MPEVVSREMPKQMRGRGESNVFYMVLDPRGKLVRSFDAFQRRMPGQRARKTSFLREFQECARTLGLPASSGPSRPVALPEFAEGTTGVRILVKLHGEGMHNYRVPVVEQVPWSRSLRRTLRHPKRAKTLEAQALLEWLGQIYPPGIMERTNQRTKHVNTIERAEGQLSLTPLGVEEGRQRAVLSGPVRLYDSGGDGFSYEGELLVALTYGEDGLPEQIRGAFDGIYPRQGRNRATRMVRLTAALEAGGE